MDPKYDLDVFLKDVPSRGETEAEGVGPEAPVQQVAEAPGNDAVVSSRKPAVKSSAKRGASKPAKPSLSSSSKKGGIHAILLDDELFYEFSLFRLHCMRKGLLDKYVSNKDFFRFMLSRLEEQADFNLK